MTTVRHGLLSQYFDQIAFKRLTPHEVDPDVSNGHEFQGVSKFRALLGAEKRKLNAEIIYLSSSDELSVRRQTGELTWYDAREGHPTRAAEYRLYYRADLAIIQDHAEEDDLCIVARPAPGSLFEHDLVVFIAERDSTWERQLAWLFGLGAAPAARRFEVRQVEAEDMDLGFAARQLLDELGIDVRDRPEDLISLIIEQHGGVFPKTAVLSDLAAGLVDASMLRDDPDRALLQLMDFEETIFRGVERHHVKKRLREGFGEDVDAFIAYSLSVQNRRKSRVGYALEAHIARILTAHRITFERGTRLEDGSRPDFLFPGAKAYADPSFPVERLRMLGAKSTCKDRWRQVLAEAGKIRTKHLLTLEPAISVGQTEEMRRSSLQLIVPREIHSSYTADQRGWLMSVAAFCAA